jgi:hypothetical protein
MYQIIEELRPYIAASDALDELEVDGLLTVALEEVQANIGAVAKQIVRRNDDIRW